MGDESPLIVYFDGLCEPVNPGGYACGGYYVAPHPFFMNTAYSGHRCFGYGKGFTNNVAEYAAALLALENVWRQGRRGRVILRGDSKIVCNQFNGTWRCESPLLKPLLNRLIKAQSTFDGLKLQWVEREHNQEADHESRIAYREATGREPPER